MQWSPDRNAGFSHANPHQLYLPVILDPEYNYEAVNVETQHRNTSSLFWFMKRLINTRKKFKAFGWGDMKFINVNNPKVLAFTRSYEDEHLLIIVNLSKYSQAAEIPLPSYKGYTPLEVFSKNHFPAITENPYFFTLGPHSFQWFALKQVQSDTARKDILIQLDLKDFDGLMLNSTKQELENDVLPFYLTKTKWFRGKDRIIYNCTISDHTILSVEDNKIYWMFVDVNYESGLPEKYQLAIRLVKGEEAKEMSNHYPQAVIARVNIGKDEWTLCDAFYCSDVRSVLMSQLANNIKRYCIEFEAKEEVKKYILEQGEITSNVHKGDENNTAFNFGNKYFLKMYRKVDTGIHPD